MSVVFITLLLIGSCNCLLDDGQTGELAAMATKIQQLEVEMAALKSGRLQQLEEEVAALKSGRLQQLEVEVAALKSGRLQQLEEEMTALKSGRLQQLEVEMAALKSGRLQLEQQVTALTSAANDDVGAIAFTASLSETLVTVGSHQQIVFDHVSTNIGSAYSPSHGHFTAPIAGAYAFFVVLTNRIGHSSSIYLMQNGQHIGHVLADDIDSMYVTSTMVMITHLQQGDEVWVQNEDAFSDVEQIDGYNYSTFSGHLIARD